LITRGTLSVKKGDPIYCRCPACRSTDVNLYEHFTVSDLYEVRGGRLADRLSEESPQATGQVDGRCVKCGHRWRLRKNVIQEAYFAADESRKTSDDDA